MAIRHWHPTKILIVWVVSAAIAWYVGTILSNLRGEPAAIVLSFFAAFLLAIAIPLVITWKWATGLEEIATPLKHTDDKGESSRNLLSDGGREKQYRVFKIKVSRALLDKGFEFPPKIPDQYRLPDETPHHETIQEMEWETAGWNLISLAPVDKESQDESVTLLALMERPFSAELAEFYSRKYPHMTL